MPAPELHGLVLVPGEGAVADEVVDVVLHPLGGLLEFLHAIPHNLLAVLAGRPVAPQARLEGRRRVHVQIVLAPRRQERTGLMHDHLGDVHVVGAVGFGMPGFRELDQVLDLGGVQGREDVDSALEPSRVAHGRILLIFGCLSYLYI